MSITVREFIVCGQSAATLAFTLSHLLSVTSPAECDAELTGHDELCAAVTSETSFPPPWKPGPV